MEILKIPKIPKNPKKYICELCNYITVSKKDYNKHLRAVLNGELKSSSTIVEKRSDYDIQEVSLFCDLDDYSSDDENDADYR